LGFFLHQLPPPTVKRFKADYGFVSSLKYLKRASTENQLKETLINFHNHERAFERADSAMAFFFSLLHTKNCMFNRYFNLIERTRGSIVARLNLMARYLAV
jgi:hypothetical protein